MNKIKKFTFVAWTEEVITGLGKSMIYTVEANGVHKAASKLASYLHNFDRTDIFRSCQVIK